MKLLDDLCHHVRTLVDTEMDKEAPLSFVILTGKMNQGKTTLVAQSHLTRFETGDLNGANLCFSPSYILLEASEAWFNDMPLLLSTILKRLNRAHARIKVTGLLLCMDSYALMTQTSSEMLAYVKEHLAWLGRLGKALGYRVDSAIFLTKLDTLLGFNEFFHDETKNDLEGSLGFSLEPFETSQKRLVNGKLRFDQMIETLGQKIIPKLHHEQHQNRSMRIREFPLQLAAGLRLPVQALISHFPEQCLTLRAIYFTSAEQGGTCIDWINKKIRTEYGLPFSETASQSKNYRACFIQKPFQTFLEGTPYYATTILRRQKKLMWLTGMLATFCMSWFLIVQFQTMHWLAETEKYLTAYDGLMSQKNNETQALYQLLLAEEKLEHTSRFFFISKRLKVLKDTLSRNMVIKLRTVFLEDLTKNLQKTMLNMSEAPEKRYQALKAYLMLGEPSRFSKEAWAHWFQQGSYEKVALNEKNLLLLKRFLMLTPKKVLLNEQAILDTRNFLNALPADYFYWQLAKDSLPKETKNLSIPGFTPSTWRIPIYFTADAYHETLLQIAELTKTFEQEQWVLERQDTGAIKKQLQQKYEADYIIFWNKIIQSIRPNPYTNLAEGQRFLKMLQTQNALKHVLKVLKKEVSPREDAGFQDFNKKIAHHFVGLSFLNDTMVSQVALSLEELNHYFETLLLLENQTEAMFEMTKHRFQNGNFSHPLNTLYQKAEELPPPLSKWVLQIANDAWFLFIRETRQHLNDVWETKVLPYYAKNIAGRYPFDGGATEEVSLAAFNEFFSPQGILTTFVHADLKPFLDMSSFEWKPKLQDGYRIPISENMMTELIRANVISKMFFGKGESTSNISFSLQKMSLDPVVASLQLSMGQKVLMDNQLSDNKVMFKWPESDAKLMLNAIDGHHFELSEKGVWAFFKMLDKINVLVDEEDSANLQILFEINGNSGRYLLHTENTINPFSPGILTGFNLKGRLA